MKKQKERRDELEVELSFDVMRSKLSCFCPKKKKEMGWGVKEEAGWGNE